MVNKLYKLMVYKQLVATCTKYIVIMTMMATTIHLKELSAYVHYVTRCNSS